MINKEIYEKINGREVLDGIRHYWLVKGYIRHHQLFSFLKEFLNGKDPFQNDSYLRLFAINVIEVRECIRNRCPKNTWINGFTIDNERFDKIYETEYARLDSLIGKTKIMKCDWCGKRVRAKAKLITEKMPDPYLIVGRIYWKIKCECNQIAYEEVD